MVEPIDDQTQQDQMNAMQLDLTQEGERMVMSARVEQNQQSYESLEFATKEHQQKDSQNNDMMNQINDLEDDNQSVFSESIVEKEGVSRNPKLIMPEADEDAFFEIQSQGSAQNNNVRRQATQVSSTFTSKPKTPNSAGIHEESKDVKFGDPSLSVGSRSHAITANTSGESQPSQQQQIKRTSTISKRSDADLVHIGSQDQKFANMFNEGIKNFRIRQFAKDRADPAFSLSHPSLLNSKYVVYKVSGHDSQGQFEGNRRYNEFFVLRQVIVANWPGIYIPSTPSKKLVGNKDVKFIIERRYYLERFILQMSQLGYLVDSNEFQTFMRPQDQYFSGQQVPGVPDIEKLLKDIQQEPPSRILIKYKMAFNMSDEEIQANSSSESRIEADTKLQQFDEFLKKMILHYKDIKNKVINLMTLKSDNMQYQRQIFNYLCKYEERNFAFSSDRPEMTVKALQKMVIGGQQNEIMRDFAKTNELLQNPFTCVFYWVKGQVSDIKAMRDALVSRDNILHIIQKIKTKKASVQKELQNCLEGRTTLKNFFKTGADKQTYNNQLQRQVKQLESTEISYSKLAVIIDKHLVDYSTVFKKNKVEDFSAIVREIAQIEVDNSNYQANYWSRVLQDPKMSTVGETTYSVNVPSL